MFSVFKRMKENNISNEQPEKNNFLDMENSAFHTQSQEDSFKDNVNYQEFVYQPPSYEDVPRYRAKNNKEIGVVVDKEQLGFNMQDLHDNIKILELEQGNDEEKIEIISDFNSPSEINKKKVEQEIITETLSLPEEKEFSDSSIKEQDQPESKEFTIFGSLEGPDGVKTYDTGHYQEEKVELESEVKTTPDGYKICPSCGAILNPEAPVCFMCSKGFIKRK